MLIDIHTHIYLRTLIDALAARDSIPMVTRDGGSEYLRIFPNEERDLGAVRPMPASFHDPQEKLRFMQASGIDQSILSIGNPWVDPFPPDEAADLAAALNSELSTLVGGQQSMAAMGVLPLQDVDAAVEEVARVAVDPQLVGVMIGTRPNGGFLDDASLDPVWAALEHNRVPAFIHPHYALGFEWVTGYGHAMPLALAFPFETTAAASRLILGGVVDRFPDLQVILAHAGGTLPYLVGRLEACVVVDELANGRRQGAIADYLRWFYYDAITYDTQSLRLLLDLVGPDRCMFGTDHPFGIADPAKVRATIHEACQDDAAREAVSWRTADAWIRTGSLPG